MLQVFIKVDTFLLNVVSSEYQNYNNKIKVFGGTLWLRCRNCSGKLQLVYLIAEKLIKILCIIITCQV